MRIKRAVNTPGERVGHESFVQRQLARDLLIQGVGGVAGFAVPAGLAQAVSLAAAGVRDPAASIAHVAIWRIFIVLFFPDSLLLSAPGC